MRLLLFYLLFAITTVSAQAQEVAEKTTWIEGDLAAAVAIAKAQNKPLLLFFNAQTNLNSRKVEINVLNDERVQKLP